jgi:hypothetical protein
MVDMTNPTSQFHPYQPQDAVPATEKVAPTGLGGMLSRLGIDQSALSGLGSNLKNVKMGDQVTKMRDMAQKNPNLVLGGLAALAIGAGLLRSRGMARR